MLTRTANIQEAAAKALQSGACQVVAGYKPGTLAMRSQPYFARNPDEAFELVWNGFCVGNLAKLILRKNVKVGVVAQGCVSRNLVGLINEGQLKREDLYVIGVPCLGMLERRKIEQRAEGREVLAAREEAESVFVSGQGFELELPRRELLRENCYTCVMRNPVIHDVLAAEAVPDAGGGSIEMLAAPWEKLDPAARQAAFFENYKDCIRCHACRDVCPLCYCNVCFVDEASPQWAGKSFEFADVATYHLTRAFHCAGRCTDCGACESACPMGLKVRRLTSKLEKDARSLYGHAPGFEIGKLAPLALFKPDDPQEFVK